MHDGKHSRSNTVPRLDLQKLVCFLAVGFVRSCTEGMQVAGAHERFILQKWLGHSVSFGRLFAAVFNRLADHELVCCKHSHGLFTTWARGELSAIALHNRQVSQMLQ